MSVSSELLCSFELLKPLDSNALKSHIKKGRNKRQQMLNSPVSRGSFPTACHMLMLTPPHSLRMYTPRVSSGGRQRERIQVKRQDGLNIQQMSYRHFPFAPVEG